MSTKRRHLTLPLLALTLVLLTGLGLVTACNSNGIETDAIRELHVRLLVETPDRPLPLNGPVNVRARAEDPGNKISHVELYAVQLPTGENNVLIRSDATPFDQTSFTSSQVFVPTATGHYVIKVVAYNKLGHMAESDYLGFDVE